MISGLGLCNSTDGGYRFSCTPPVDPTFDGGIALQMAELQSGDAPIRYGAGLVCGGEISEPMSGWVHTTADGGGKPHDHHRLTSRFCVNSPKIPGNHLFRVDRELEPADAADEIPDPIRGLLRGAGGRRGRRL